MYNVTRQPQTRPYAAYLGAGALLLAALAAASSIAEGLARMAQTTAMGSRYL